MQQWSWKLRILLKLWIGKVEAIWRIISLNHHPPTTSLYWKIISVCACIRLLWDRRGSRDVSFTWSFLCVNVHGECSGETWTRALTTFWWSRVIHRRHIPRPYLTLTVSYKITWIKPLYAPIKAGLGLFSLNISFNILGKMVIRRKIQSDNSVTFVQVLTLL